MESIKWLKKQEHFDWMQKGLVCWQMCEKIIIKCVEGKKYVHVINACRDTLKLFAVACLDVAIKEGKNLISPDFPERPEMAV